MLDESLSGPWGPRRGISAADALLFFSFCLFFLGMLFVCSFSLPNSRLSSVSVCVAMSMMRSLALFAVAAAVVVVEAQRCPLQFDGRVGRMWCWMGLMEARVCLIRGL